MGYIFLIAIFVLGIMLFMMLNQTEKTYGYTKTVLITHTADGSDEVESILESGIIFINSRFAVIEGESYLYKTSDKNKRQARLNYDGNNLKSVSLFLPDGAEKVFYVTKLKSVKDLRR